MVISKSSVINKSLRILTYTLHSNKLSHNKNVGITRIALRVNIVVYILDNKR